MKRRDFLKLLGIAPLAPSVLAAKETPPIDLSKKMPQPPDDSTETTTFSPDGVDSVYMTFDCASANSQDYTVIYYALNSEGEYVRISSEDFQCVLNEGSE